MAIKRNEIVPLLIAITKDAANRKTDCAAL